jgi:hypothetical protein
MFEEIWKTINNLKIYFKNKEDEIVLSMVANLQIYYEKRKNVYKKDYRFF